MPTKGDNKMRIIFVDLEKAYDCQSRDLEMMRKGNKRSGKGTRLIIGPGMPHSEVGKSNIFGSRLGCTALNPYLFLLVIYVMADDVINNVHQSMMFEDDNVLCCEDELCMT